MARIATYRILLKDRHSNAQIVRIKRINKNQQYYNFFLSLTCVCAFIRYKCCMLRQRHTREKVRCRPPVKGELWATTLDAFITFCRYIIMAQSDFIYYIPSTSYLLSLYLFVYMYGFNISMVKTSNARY